MIPYDSFSFFLWLLIPVVPAIGLGLAEVSSKVRTVYLLLATLGMLWLILHPVNLLVQAAVFFGWEYAIVYGYLRYRQSARGHNKTAVFYTAVAASILPLFLVKLFSRPTAALDALSQVPKAQVNHFTLGFLGVSYLTFRIVGTIIEIRDGLIKEIKLPGFICFVLFFPTLASGPIDRYRRFLADLRRPLTRHQYGQYLVEGVESVMRGLLYKFIIAYLVNQYALVPLGHKHGLAATLEYMYAYSAYLFFDFAGYSAFAVGVSRFFAIKTPENFQAPFWAKNIKDFWNRWHISLSTWFRDYIYMRFMLVSAKKKLFANRYAASAVGYLLLFLLMGFWHGFAWRYVIYGLYMALLMIAFEALERWNKQRHFWGEGLGWNLLARLCTLNLVCFGLLIFSGRLG